MPYGFALRPMSSLAGFVEFADATFRAGAGEAERPRHDAGLLGSLVYRPMVFRRNDVGWVAACAICLPRQSGRREWPQGTLVTAALDLPFLQVFADRPCSGVSHPKEFAKLPPLERIADPLGAMILVDDLATSGWHVEESLTALRRLGTAASAITWITGTVT